MFLVQLELVNFENDLCVFDIIVLSFVIVKLMIDIAGPKNHLCLSDSIGSFILYVFLVLEITFFGIYMDDNSAQIAPTSRRVKHLLTYYLCIDKSVGNLLRLFNRCSI